MSIASIIDENININVCQESNIVRVRDIDLENIERRVLCSQSGGLGFSFSGCDDMVTECGKSDGGSFAKARTGSGDDNCFFMVMYFSLWCCD